MFYTEQEYKGQKYKFDIDSSPQVFLLFDKIYPNSIKEKYSVSDPKFFRYFSKKDFSEKGYIEAPQDNSINRLFAVSNKISAKGTICINGQVYEFYNAVERLSGDCFFNFNNKKVSVLKRIEGIDEDKLRECVSMHHSIYNLVLLQTMGNMQSRKQQGLKLSDNIYEQLDRGDTFLYLLDSFYTDKNEEILTASTSINRNILKGYLKSNFNNVYDYAEQMLQINDKNFIDKLIENGNQKLDSSNVNQFLDLALDFWNERKTNIEPKISSNF